MDTEICRDLNKLHPFVKRAAEAFLNECNRQGLNIKITETYRTVERQDYLFSLGRTKPGKVVTNARGAYMSSYHQWGLAFDICHNVKGNEYDFKILKQAGLIGEKMGLEWGGGWSGFVDSAHFQYTFGLSISDLLSGKKPPSYIKPSLDNKNEELNKAVQELSIQEIIGNPAVWNDPERIRTSNLMPLVIKFGVLVYGTSDYAETIENMVDDQIISSPQIWRTHTYTVRDIMSLLIKMAAKIKIRRENN